MDLVVLHFMLVVSLVILLKKSLFHQVLTKGKSIVAALPLQHQMLKVILVVSLVIHGK